MKSNTMQLKAILSFCIISIGIMLFANDDSVTIQGIVFDDTNHNLKFDETEKGIANILVSNQHDVVRTNEKGEYQIQIDKNEAIVYVVKPSNYSLPLGENNLPQFYYIHKPKGSPEHEYKGMTATGKLPEMLNFPLHKVTPADTFSFIAIADPQPKTREKLNYFRDDLVSELITTDAAFSVVLGDIVYDSLALYHPYNKIMSKMDIPVFNLAGNHDFNLNVDNKNQTLETFQSIYGPEYYAFEYGKVSFVVFNNVKWLDEPDSANKRGYKGQISEEQLKWFENYLDYVPEDRLIIFCMHVPICPFDAKEAEYDFIVNRDKLFELLQDRDRLLSISGHRHSIANIFLNKEMGWNSETPFLQIACSAGSGSLWKGEKDERGIPFATQSDGSPNGYHIITIEGANYSQQFKAANKDENYQIRISSPTGTVASEELDSSLIVANFFNGSAIDKLTYQIDKAVPVSMNYTPMADPFMEKLYNKKTISYHIWTSKLPSNLAPGVHSIIIKASDHYGNDYHQSGIFEIK